MYSRLRVFIFLGKSHVHVPCFDSACMLWSNQSVDHITAVTLLTALEEFFLQQLINISLYLFLGEGWYCKEKKKISDRQNDSFSKIVLQAQT